MSELSELEIYGLWNWLDAATQGLSAESRIRIEEEIRAHFESARESEMATCANPEEAGLSAIISLGDPVVANKAYRKVLLTESEAELLNAMKKRQSSSAWTRLFERSNKIFIVVTQLVVAFTIYDGDFGKELHSEKAFAIWSVFGFIALFVLPPFLPKRSRRLSRAYNCLVPILLFGCIYLMKGIQLKLSFAAIVAIVFIATFRTMRRASHLRRKLPVEDWPDGLFM